MPATLDPPPAAATPAPGSAPPAPDVRLTEAEYLRIERNESEGQRTEFSQGELLPMAGESELHIDLAKAIERAFDDLIAGRPMKTFRSNMRLRVADGRFRYPDVMLTPRPPEMLDGEQDTVTNPLVLVEVLSPTTEAVDRGAKLEEYRTIPSLTDYLLVSQEEPSVDHYTRLSETEWKLVTYAGPDAAVPVTGVGDLKLGPLYPAD
ncbi:Uma2 family endonuclease [Alienimonas sp. DA493]|uniref:Uma2 family endonuclease n=1 Tax=Alienimonas sp. DA493 TaxID=3373605 RepID=UPI003754ABCD